MLEKLYWTVSQISVNLAKNIPRSLNGFGEQTNIPARSSQTLFFLRPILTLTWLTQMNWLSLELQCTACKWLYRFSMVVKLFLVTECLGKFYEQECWTKHLHTQRKLTAGVFFLYFLYSLRVAFLVYQNVIICLFNVNK